MRFNHAFQIRCALCGAALLALGLAFVRISSLSAGQAAVSLSRPGQEDLTFWVNHNGLAELDVEGEVGFGDMARILMRRRVNSDRMRAMRDRFTFKVQEMAALNTPDQFRVDIGDDGYSGRDRFETGGAEALALQIPSDGSISALRALLSRLEDAGIELALEVHDVERDSELGGDPPGVIGRVKRATALLELRVGIGDVVETHPDADGFVTLACDERGGDRRIHSPGHRHEDPAHTPTPWPSGSAATATEPTRIEAMTRGTISVAVSISASVVVRPSDKRRAPRASSSG